MEIVVIVASRAEESHRSHQRSVLGTADAECHHTEFIAVDDSRLIETGGEHLIGSEVLSRHRATEVCDDLIDAFRPPLLHRPHDPEPMALRLSDLIVRTPPTTTASTPRSAHDSISGRRPAVT